MQIKKLIKSSGRALLLTVVAYIGTTQIVHAATAVSGMISTDTTWSLALSPYQVTFDVSVITGATLTVEAGVVIAFNPGMNLTVTDGALSARGTAGQPIIFTSILETTAGTPAPGDWGQLRFLDGTNDSTTILEYAQIRYGKGLSVQAAAPTFNYLQITKNLGSAISIDLNSSPKGIGNQATGNTLNGISVPAGDLVGSITWGIKGIPYVVASGTVSVGASPTITAMNPAEVQQSLSVDALISGTRLAGAESIKFDATGINATLLAGNTDTSLAVRISASAIQPLGYIPFEVKVAAGKIRYTTGINVIPLKPTIALTSIAPGSMRRAESKSFQINGSYLLGAQVTVPVGVGLSLSNLLTSDTQANFNLTSTATATLGSQPISVTNPALANGTAAMLVTIVDSLPKINTNTIPSAVVPDAVARTFQLSLTNVDTVDHSFNLSTLDSGIISVFPALVTIPAGSLSVNITLAGLQLGYTTLNITSPTLAAVSKQIYASNLLNGAIVGPVLSSFVSVEVPVNLSQLPNNVLSSSITVNTPLTVGSVVSVLSPSITVDTPLSYGSVVSDLSSSITVDVPSNLVGPILSSQIIVSVP